MGAVFEVYVVGCKALPILVQPMTLVRNLTCPSRLISSYVAAEPLLRTLEHEGIRL